MTTGHSYSDMLETMSKRSHRKAVIGQQHPIVYSQLLWCCRFDDQEWLYNLGVLLYGSQMLSVQVWNLLFGMSLATEYPGWLNTMCKIAAGAKSSKPLKYTSFGAACSEVEIDLLTGEKTILQSDLYFDCGRSLNPAVDIGQVSIAQHSTGHLSFELTWIPPFLGLFHICDLHTNHLSLWRLWWLVCL